MNDPQKMMVALAKHDGKYGVIELPATDKAIQDLCQSLDVENPAALTIQYAGTGTDALIDATIFNDKMMQRWVRLDELNLMAYLLNRVQYSRNEEYRQRLSDADASSTPVEISTIINDIYQDLGRFGKKQYQYTGENLSELIEAERKCLAPYPEMNKDVFWEMISRARNESMGDDDKMEQILTETLAKMPEEDIRTYFYIFQVYMGEANQDAIYNEGAYLNSGLSSDGFIDFRKWLISQGEAMYMSILKDPETLRNLDFKVGEDYTWETFGYIPAYAYEARTGRNIYKDLLPKDPPDLKAEIKADMKDKYKLLDQAEQDSIEYAKTEDFDMMWHYKRAFEAPDTATDDEVKKQVQESYKLQRLCELQCDKDHHLWRELYADPESGSSDITCDRCGEQHTVFW